MSEDTQNPAGLNLRTLRTQYLLMIGEQLKTLLKFRAPYFHFCDDKGHERLLTLEEDKFNDLQNNLIFMLKSVNAVYPTFEEFKKKSGSGRGIVPQGQPCASRTENP